MENIDFWDYVDRCITDLILASTNRDAQAVEKVVERLEDLIRELHTTTSD